MTTIQPVSASGVESARVPSPTVVLFSCDEELIELVEKLATHPWQLELCEDLASGRQALSRSTVRLVIVDDSAVDEAVRGWLLDRIRKFVPQALLIYVACVHTEADEKRARGYSAQYYTAKPFDLDRMSRVIESFLRAACIRDAGPAASGQRIH